MTRGDADDWCLDVLMVLRFLNGDFVDIELTWLVQLDANEWVEWTRAWEEMILQSIVVIASFGNQKGNYQMYSYVYRLKHIQSHCPCRNRQCIFFVSMWLPITRICECYCWWTKILHQLGRWKYCNLQSLSWEIHTFAHIFTISIDSHYFAQKNININST